MRAASIGGMNINNLRCADDVVLLAGNQEDLHKLVDEVNAIGLTYNWTMNTKKTKKNVISRTKKNRIK